MMAAENGISQAQQNSRNYFANIPGLLERSRNEGAGGYPLDFPSQEFGWAEQIYRAGDTVAVVAVYKNLPDKFRQDVDQLIFEEYRKKLFRVPLFEASLLLLSSGCFPRFRSLYERSKQFYGDSSIDRQQQKALEFISCRDPKDIVVLVMRSDELIATMTLFPFSRKKDIPSLNYLEMDPAFDLLPDVPALEVGRLAKVTSRGNNGDCQGNDLINTMAMAAAFIVARKFAIQNNLLSHGDSYICGDTYGSLISSLNRFFPLNTINSTVNPNVLEDENKVHGTGMYFIQRQVLGSFQSAGDLVSTIETIENSHPEIAQRIKHLLESDLKSNGVNTIEKFDPEKFRIKFFYFPYHHPKIDQGFNRLEKMMQRIATSYKRAQQLSVFT